MRKSLKVVKNVSITILALLVVVVGAGVGYTWYVSENSDKNSQAFQEPASRFEAPKATKRKVDPNAVVSASVQSVTSPVTPGSNSSILVKTNPEANCTISVVYAQTQSKDSGLAPKKADEYGLVEWTWTVDSSVPIGTWPIKVTCANAKNSAFIQNDLQVVRSLE